MLGTICPGGSIFWGPEVQGDRKWGTGSPGTKWARDQMRRSQNMDNEAILESLDTNELPEEEEDEEPEHTNLKSDNHFKPIHNCG